MSNTQSNYILVDQSGHATVKAFWTDASARRYAKQKGYLACWRVRMQSAKSYELKRKSGAMRQDEPVGIMQRVL